MFKPPFCKKCNKQVDDFFLLEEHPGWEWKDRHKRSLKLIIECHGKTEKIDLSWITESKTWVQSIELLLKKQFFKRQIMNSCILECYKADIKNGHLPDDICELIDWQFRDFE